LNEKLAQHDREQTLFAPASEYLKSSVADVSSALDEVCTCRLSLDGVDALKSIVPR